MAQLKRWVEALAVSPDETLRKRRLERFPLRRSKSIAAMANIVGAFIVRKEAEGGGDERAHLLEAPWPGGS